MISKIIFRSAHRNTSCGVLDIASNKYKPSAKHAPNTNTGDRTENVIRIQAWYRGVRDARVAKMEMRRAFEGDVMGLPALRCLMLIGRDDEVLGKWSVRGAQAGNDSQQRCREVLT